MKLLIVLLLVATVQAQSRRFGCTQVEFSGEATQSDRFTQALGGGLSFSVLPMRLKEDTRWGWFQVRVLGDEKRGIFVFNPSDTNWLLATDFYSAFIGGVNSDLKAGLGYRTRYFAFPVSRVDKRKLVAGAQRLNVAETPHEMRKAIAVLNSMRLGQLVFEITDYHLSDEDPPMSVESVNFTVRVVLPPEVPMSASLGAVYIDCPGVAEEVIENIRNPKGHEYLLPRQLSTNNISK